MHYPYKICDPVHGFIRFEAPVGQLIDSSLFQRLRYIHQMGVAYLIYPGATHSRFEHSLGVMELATRIYNTLINPSNSTHSLSFSEEEITYWRLILRLAALCHDLGHLPFSHTAEKDVLPKGGHERMTVELIQSEELSSIWEEIGPSAKTDIMKLSVSEKELKVFSKESTLTPWQRVLSQVITEDNFGADRMDYLIRDAQYTGVGYGHFDYHQLIDTLRILPYRNGLALGVAASGIQSVEALWITRYMMYARVYQHPKARVYSNHMNRFLCRHYSQGVPTHRKKWLEQTDYVILTALYSKAQMGDYDAKCLLKMEKTFQNVLPNGYSEEWALSFLEGLREAFGEWIFIDYLPQKKGSREFPVLLEDGRVISSFVVSSFLKDIPRGGKPLYLHAHPNYVEKVKKWIYERAHPESAG